MTLTLNFINFEIQLLQLLQMVFSWQLNRSRQSKPFLSIGGFSGIGNPYPTEDIADEKPVRDKDATTRANDAAREIRYISEPMNERPAKPSRHADKDRKPSADDDCE